MPPESGLGLGEEELGTTEDSARESRVAHSAGERTEGMVRATRPSYSGMGVWAQGMGWAPAMVGSCWEGDGDGDGEGSERRKDGGRVTGREV